MRGYLLLLAQGETCEKGDFYVRAIDRMPPPAPETAWRAALEEAILNCDTDLRDGGSGKERAHLNKAEIQYEIDFLVIVKGKIFNIRLA
jgi:hypothetical protein